MDRGDIHSLIQRYFNEELNDEETDNLFSIIRQDTEAEQVFNEYLLAMDAIHHAGRSDLKTDLKKAGAIQDANRGKKTTLLLIILAAALAAGLIFLIFFKSNRVAQSQHRMPERDSTLQSIEGIDIAREQQDSNAINPLISIPEEELKEALAQNDNPSVDADAIYDKYYTPFRDESLEGVTRGTEITDPVLIFQSLYWDKNYPEATVLFEKRLSSNSNNDNLLFQYAVCLLETKRYGEAEKFFYGLTERNETRFEEEVTYYLVLTLIKNKKMGTAKKLISQTMEEKAGKYFQKYNEINKELNK